MRFLKGQSLIELLIAIAFSGIVIPVLFSSLLSSYDSQAQRKSRVVALDIINDQYERLRLVRQQGWSNIASNGTYHVDENGNSWALVSGARTDGDFTTNIIITDAYRDPSGNLADVPGVVDPSTKKITITSSWNQPYASSISKNFYLTRYLENNAFIHTTENDFNLGVLNGTVVSNTDGGEVILGAGGGGNWCSPDLVIAAVDLPKSGVANAISAVEGEVVTGTGDNSSGVSFASVGLSNDSPPAATLGATFDGYKTNDVFNDGNYGYIATDTNSSEVVIIDLNNVVNGKFQQVGYYNIPENTDAESVYVDPENPNVGLVTTTSNKLYSFNLSSKSGSRSTISSVNLAARGTSVVARQNHAFVSIAGSTQEMQIIQYDSNGSNLQVVGYADVNGQGATDVAVNSDITRAYLATGENSSKREFFIINLDQKTGSRPIVGSYDTNGMNPNGVTIVTSNKAIIVGNNAEEYQVIDVANESNPVRCGGININTGVNGISSVLEDDGDAYSYIVTGDSSSELKIIEGGPGGTYTGAGEYISSIFDAGSDIVFNRLTAQATVPVSTTAKVQVAVAKAVNGSCTNANYVYVGPDGTSSSYFPATGGTIPFDQDGSGFENPGRCMRYRAQLSTTDIFYSPVIYEVLVNYSP